MQAADSSSVKDSTMLNKYPVHVKIPLEYVLFAPSWCRQRELDMVQVEALGIAADCDYGATFNLFLGIVLVVKVAGNTPLNDFTGHDLSSFSHLTRQDCDDFFGKNLLPASFGRLLRITAYAASVSVKPHHPNRQAEASTT